LSFRVFTPFYLSIFRHDFRFPQALLLFPIGIAVIWCFDALRIVALIAIGHEISPDMALGGFHSQAGWLAFVLVAAGSLVIAYRVRFFSHATRSAKTSPINSNVALLLPLIALSSTTVLTAALSADFDWLYPVRVFATIGTLLLLHRHLSGLFPYQFSFVPIIASVGVFLIWLALVADDAIVNATFAMELSVTAQAIAGFWIVFRAIGSVAPVPIAEELAFRGYLVERLTGTNPDTRLAFSWPAWIASSVAFGLLHGAWIAGIAAELVYGLVRYHRDKITDAIVVHAVTNGAWSLSSWLLCNSLLCNSQRAIWSGQFALFSPSLNFTQTICIHHGQVPRSS
jgi:exosortase E/protease (VPEID-CTERM system)